MANTFKNPYESNVQGYKDTIASETARYAAAGNDFTGTSRYKNLNTNIGYYSEGGQGYNDALRDFKLNEASAAAPSLGLTTDQLATNPELANDPVALAKYTGKTANGVNYAAGTPDWKAAQTQNQDFNAKTGGAMGLAQKYQTTLNNLNTSGTAAPATPGLANKAIAGATPPPPPPPPNTSLINSTLEADPGYQAIVQQQREYDATENQRQSFTQLLQPEIAALEGVNTEMMNLKNIIDGAEDDIRKEVQAAGGFASDSQVIALSNARNKQNILNYNKLVDLYNAKQKHLDTMTNLAEKDRADAKEKLAMDMQFEQMKMQYRDKFVAHATEAYENVRKAAGYTGLYNSLVSDPNALALAERTLGMAPGGMAQLAAQEQKKAQELGAGDTEVVKLDNGQSILINSKTGQTIKNLGGAQPTTTPVNPKAGSSNPIQTLEDIKNAPVSDLTKAVMTGTIKLKELTPTDKSKVAVELYQTGFNPQQYVLGKLDTLIAKLQDVPDNFKGLFQGNFQPLASSRDAKVAEFESQKQVLTREIARLNDVGVLSDQDVAAYKAAMPSRGDRDIEVSKSKVSGIRSAIGTGSPAIKGTPVSPGSVIEYQGKKYNVDANGNMTPI